MYIYSQAALIDNKMKTKNRKVTKDITYPISIKKPSVSNKPRVTKNIDQPAVRLVKGIGKGKARQIPKKNINTPLIIGTDP